MASQSGDFRLLEFNLENCAYQLNYWKDFYVTSPYPKAHELSRLNLESVYVYLYALDVSCAPRKYQEEKASLLADVTLFLEKKTN